MSEDEVVEEFRRCNETLLKFGVEPNLMRPPEGFFTDDVIKVSSTMEYDIILWSIDTRDWAHTPSECIVKNVLENGKRVMEFICNGNIYEILDQIGNMPLPPYIKKQYKDQSRYQTVYNKVSGSSAAPTAGLHFTNELLEKIKAKGVTIVEVLLHVGLGTFRPVDSTNILEHKMHSEYIELSEENAEILNIAKKEGRRIIAVGTTSIRVLESSSNENGVLIPCKKETDIFIYPGYKFKVVDGIITNFHLPESTLIMLVSAFLGYEKTMEMYRIAVNEKYRFFSFGDATLLI